MVGAAKDVIVEAERDAVVKEGRWITTAARRYKRIVQVGTQGRSGTHFKEVIPLLRDGAVGKIHSVRFSSYRNVMPGFGRPTASAPPPGLDYDMWLGPAPQRAYTPHRGLYHFRRPDPGESALARAHQTRIRANPELNRR